MRKCAYIDEAGNKDTEVPKQGATNFYVLGCALVDAEQIPALEAAVEQVAKKYFSGGPLKSSGVGDDDLRRRRVLEAITAVPAQFYALAIDKRKLFQETGLRFGRSFYKWVLRHAAGELMRSFEDIELVVDNHGSDRFRKEVEVYMERRYAGELFARSRFRFTQSAQSRGVQVADMVAGSVFKSLERGEPPLLDPIREKLIFTGAWPRDAFPYHLDRDVAVAERRADPRIVELILRRARAFVRDYSRREHDEERAQVLVVQHLLDRYLAEPSSYVPGAALRRLVRAQVLGVADKPRSFMTRVDRAGAGRARDDCRVHKGLQAADLRCRGAAALRPNLQQGRSDDLAHAPIPRRCAPRDRWRGRPLPPAGVRVPPAYRSRQRRPAARGQRAGCLQAELCRQSRRSSIARRRAECRALGYRGFSGPLC